MLRTSFTIIVHWPQTTPEWELLNQGRPDEVLLRFRSTVHCASLFVHDNPLISSLSPCCQKFYCDKRRDVRDKITATWSVAWHGRQPLPHLRELTRQQFIASPRTTRFMAYWVADLCVVRTDFIVENHCCGSDVADCMQCNDQFCMASNYYEVLGCVIGFEWDNKYNYLTFAWSFIRK